MVMSKITVSRPRFFVPRSFQLGKVPDLGVPWDAVLGVDSAYGDVVRLVGHSAMAAVGIYTGVEGSGLWSVLGWAVGVGSGICALLELGDLVIPSDAQKS